MNRQFLQKTVLIILLMGLLLVPLGMIQGVISERSHYRYTAQQDIASSWTGEQNFLGPILVLPYVTQWQVKVWDKEQKIYRMETRKKQAKMALLPQQLDIDAKSSTQMRARGIYEVPVYDTHLDVQGRFIIPAATERLQLDEGVSISWQQPYMSVAIQDIRGIVVQPELIWGDETMEFHSGSRLPKLPGGMHAELPGLANEQQVEQNFRFKLDLHGMQSLMFSPSGKNTRVRMQSDWPHPSFIGRYLPTERQIDETAFSAEWQVSAFSSNMSESVKQLLAGTPQPFQSNTFGVSLVDPVDIYLQTERAVKYAGLFLLLTFAAFFLFEIMKSLRLHPMQYLLVGMALTLFYLLLVSLSEHMAFAGAYWLATLACSGLIGVYLSAVLKTRGRALGFTAALLLLYGMLFLILRSEDNALLMGSLLLFGLLAAAMTVTRKLDWYALTNKVAGPEKEQIPAG